jgi:predicted metal-dependent hydrolase
LTAALRPPPAQLALPFAATARAPDAPSASPTTSGAGASLVGERIAALPPATVSAPLPAAAATSGLCAPPPRVTGSPAHAADRALVPVGRPLPSPATAATLELDGEHIEFQLRRSPRRRRAALSLCDRGLVLAVPSRMPQRAIDRFLEASRPWLRRHLPRWREGVGIPLDARGRPLELLWLGRALAVDLQPAPGEATLAHEDGRIVVRGASEADAEAVRALLRTWLCAQALPWFGERVRAHAPLLQVDEPPLRLTDARTLWGSCTPAGVIRLNWRLMQAPPALIDYVVVHELAHLRQPDHSAAFWSLVARACPDHRALRRELRGWQRRLAAL